jgi:gliding motility-associated lipoprotein GldH
MKLTKYILFFCFGLLSCKQVQLYEKLQNIKGAQWQTAELKNFTFNITDTTKRYNVYVVLRHTDLYPYKNLWLKIGVKQQADSVQYQNFELPIASDEAWLGTGMNDVYERRIALFSTPIGFKKGDVQFSLQQIMRQNPLPEVLQVGLRVEPQL